MDHIYSWLWQERFWLTGNHALKELQDKDQIARPHAKDLLIIPLYVVMIFFIRILYERLIATPFAKRFIPSKGINRVLPIQNATFEEYFKQNPNPNKKEIDALSKRTDWSTSAIDKWFRRRRNMVRPNIQYKFCEARGLRMNSTPYNQKLIQRNVPIGWRFLFYTCIFTYGICVLWESPWFWDHAQCWEDLYNQNVDFGVYIYYVTELSFYFSLLLSISRDVKRKDFTEQIIHHLTTLLLISFSYVMNYIRIGTLVMAIHDISDIFLEGAKCFHYLKMKEWAEGAFVIFAIVFMVSRLVLFPFWVIHTSLIKSLIVEDLEGYYFFNGMLLTLQCLHIFWMWTILKMAIKMCHDELKKDERSDAEESTDQE